MRVRPLPDSTSVVYVLRATFDRSGSRQAACAVIMTSLTITDFAYDLRHRSHSARSFSTRGGRQCATMSPCTTTWRARRGKGWGRRGAHEEDALAAAAGVLGQVQRLAVVDDGDVAAQRAQIALRVVVQVLRASSRR